MRAASDDNFYELLGVEPHADVDEIKSAFRRLALDLHPDVKPDDEDAQQRFMAAKEAYETLSDERARAEYDRLHRVGRRFGFFQDVDPLESEGLRAWRDRRADWARPGYDSGDEDDYMPQSSPFRWSDLGSDAGAADDGMPAEDDDGDSPSSSTGHDDDSEAERLSQLLQFLQQGGSLSAWQRGGDPWGSSTSDAWARQVDRQMQDPRFGGGGRGRSSDDGEWGEWSPPGRRFGDDGFDGDMLRRRHGWSAPGRNPAWQPPGRRDDADRPPDRGFGNGGGSRRGWAGDGGSGRVV